MTGIETVVPIQLNSILWFVIRFLLHTLFVCRVQAAQQPDRSKHVSFHLKLQVWIFHVSVLKASYYNLYWKGNFVSNGLLKWRTLKCCAWSEIWFKRHGKVQGRYGQNGLEENNKKNRNPSRPRHGKGTSCVLASICLQSESFDSRSCHHDQWLLTSYYFKTMLMN